MTGPVRELPAYNLALERLLEIFTAPDQSFDDKARLVLGFCTNYFDLPICVIGEVHGDNYELKFAIDPTGTRRDGSVYTLDKTFCAIAIEFGEALAVHSIPDSKYSGYSAHSLRILETYVGAPIRVNGKILGMIACGGMEKRETPFEPADVTLIRLVANWLGREFEAEAKSRVLAQSEKRFRRQYRKLPVIAFTHDRDMKITDVSDFLLDRLGYTRDELIGRETVEFAVEALRDRIRRVDHPMYWATGSSHNLPRSIVTKTGQILDVELSAVAFEGPDGTFNSGQAVMMDLSERNRVQEKLAQKNAELEQVNEQLRHFAYIASHDLQEPLRKIRVFGDQLNDEAGRNLSSEGQFALDTMISAAERLSNLVADVLSFSRVSYAEFSVHKVDIGEVVSQVTTVLEEKIVETGAQVEIGDLPVVRGDLVQITRLLMNLISNAIKYQRPNSTPKIVISAHFDPQKNVAEIIVTDNGIGFPNAYCEKIFQPFQRLNQRSMYSGSGIGLAVARTIVEKHGWTITARGDPGVGSVFKILLPGAHIVATDAAGAASEVA